MENKEIYVGNDAGNASMKMVIDGELFEQPSVVVPITTLPNMDAMNAAWVLENGMDNIVATIESKELNQGMSSTYYVGKYALTSGKILKNIRVGGRNSKVDSDIPLITTLSMLAMYACKKNVKNIDSDDFENNINMDINMATALPVNQHNKENATKYKNKFEGKHKVTIFLGNKKVKVNINIGYTYVMAEGVTTAFYLTENKIFKDDDISKSKILHVPIGEGTTEYVLTEGLHFDPRFTDGDTNGVGKAINSALPRFINEFGYSKLSRQEFIDILKDASDHYHNDAVAFIEEPLREQAYLISENIIKNVEKANFKLDLVLIYGGGSVLMQDFLEEELKDYLTEHRIKLYFVPEELAVNIEAKGLYSFTQGFIFKKLLEMNEK